LEALENRFFDGRGEAIAEVDLPEFGDDLPGLCGLGLCRLMSFHRMVYGGVCQ